jgi:hypothetical protein
VAQALEARAIVGAHRPPRVKVEARVARVPRRLGLRRVRVRVVADPRDARVRRASEYAAAGDRCSAERGKRRRVFDERIWHVPI